MNGLILVTMFSLASAVWSNDWTPRVATEGAMVTLEKEVSPAPVPKPIPKPDPDGAGIGTKLESPLDTYHEAKALIAKGNDLADRGKVILDQEKIKAVIEQGGELSLGEVLRLRVRHMSDGVALGSRAFVNEVFTLHREKFGPNRKDGARPIRALASIGMMALRDLRVRALG